MNREDFEDLMLKYKDYCVVYRKINNQEFYTKNPEKLLKSLEKHKPALVIEENGLEKRVYWVIWEVLIVLTFRLKENEKELILIEFFMLIR
jgi:hypothetical protein